MNKRQQRHQREQEQRRRDILDSIALTGEKTMRQIADDLGLGLSTAIRHVSSMRQPGLKFLYIVRWLRQEGGGGWAPVYATDHKPDAPKPKMGGATIDSETLMRREAEKKLQQIKPPPAANDPFLAWMLPKQEQRKAA